MNEPRIPATRQEADAFLCMDKSDALPTYRQSVMARRHKAFADRVWRTMHNLREGLISQTTAISQIEIDLGILRHHDEAERCAEVGQ